MSVLRHNQLFVATRVTGPQHNLLGLDFTDDLAPYARDLSSGEGDKRIDIENVREQVNAAAIEFASEHGPLPVVAGIHYLSSDTPSDTAYHVLAMEIFGSLSRIDELDTFEPRW